MKRCIECEVILPSDDVLSLLDHCRTCLQKMILSNPELLKLMREVSNR